jgi:hypothetical protein
MCRRPNKRQRKRSNDERPKKIVREKRLREDKQG